MYEALRYVFSISEVCRALSLLQKSLLQYISTFGYVCILGCVLEQQQSVARLLEKKQRLWRKAAKKKNQGCPNMHCRLPTVGLKLLMHEAANY
jgi:hypothetical protein